MCEEPSVFDPAVVSRLAGSMYLLAVLPEVFVYEIYCRDDRRRLAGPGYEFSSNLVMVRSGGFLQRLDGREDFYDATSAYLSRPGQERYTGHPAGPGDVTLDGPFPAAVEAVRAGIASRDKPVVAVSGGTHGAALVDPAVGYAQVRQAVLRFIQTITQT